MADKKVSGLGAATVADNDLFLLVDVSGNTSANLTATDLKSYVDGPENIYKASDFDVLGDGTDETSLMQSAIDTVPSGSIIHLDGNKTYKFNINIAKSLALEGNGATIQGVTTNPVIKFGNAGGASPTAHAVTETTLNYGNTQFTVSGASTKFSVGDIGTLWDSAVRPAGGDVNFHAVRIKSISTDVVTVEAPIRTFLGAGSITFEHDTKQVSDAGVNNVNVVPVDSAIIALFWEHVHRPFYDNITGTNTNGPGISIRKSYDIRGGTSYFEKPFATGSGQGYGVQLLGVTEAYIQSAKGDGMRHVFDMDSAYGVRIGEVSDWNPASSPCTLAHNGFAGDIHLEQYRGANPFGAYPVSTSSQGFGTAAGEPRAENHPVRNVWIGDINVVQKDTDPNLFSVCGVYFRGHVENVYIGSITARYEDQTALATGAASRAVRANGTTSGYFTVGSINVDRVGEALTFFELLSRSVEQGVITVGSIIVDTGNSFVTMQGHRHLHCPYSYMENLVDTGGLFILQSATSGEPKGVDIGQVHYDLTQKVEIIERSSLSEPPPGSVVPSMRNSGTSISPVDGVTPSSDDVQNRAGWLRLTGGTDGTTDVLSGFPAPWVEGAEITVEGKIGTRNDVTIPDGANVDGPITFSSSMPRAKLRAYAGKWRLVG